jgi:phage FluMu gp28-like protein
MESREQFIARLRRECIDEAQWLQEYCCIPAEETDSFITWDLLTSCEDPELRLLTADDLATYLDRSSSETDWDASSTDSPTATASDASPINPSTYQLINSPFYLGVDVARKHDLCVIDLGEKIGDVIWDRVRIELHNKTFSEIEFELFRLLKLKQLKRCCIDATGMGVHLAERAANRFTWKVEPITFTAAIKEELAYGLRHDFQDRKIRIPADDALRADLRGVRKEVSSSGNIRFLGEVEGSHCDRFWAKALRQHAARNHAAVPRATVG